MVPLRSAITLLVTPALISDWVPMIERVRPAQLTMMVVSGSGAARPARSTSSAPGTLTEPGMFMVAYSSKRRTSRIVMLASLCNQRRDLLRGQRGRVPARLDQFAKGLGVGIDVLEQFVARRLPGLQPAVELANIGVAQRREAIRRLRHEAFAGIIDDDRHVLARQPRLGFERDPLGRHVGGKQRMAGGEGGLVPEIEQRDFLAQQQGGADLRGGDGG